MIEKLTKEQELGISEWQQHCLKIGRDTSPVNKKLTEESWKKFYFILKKNTPSFWYCQSPLQAQIIINIWPKIEKIIKLSLGANIRANIWENIGANIWENIRANIWENIGENIEANIRANIEENIRANIGENIEENIRANIRANIWANIGENIRANIWENIGANIWENIRANIWENIGENIEANIRANIEENIRANIWANIGENIRANIRANIWANIRDNKLKYIETFSWCQHDINWIGYYKYFEKYGLLPTDNNFKIFNIWYDLACSCGWCYTFENMVFVCEKPLKLFLNQQDRLHMDGGMAIEYSDGYGLWILNGIRVPKYLAETKSESLDIEFFKKETNVEVRAAFIRKYGIDRLSNMGNKKDTLGTYELLDMAPIFKNVGYAPYLKMVNPSTGTYHIEGVHPSCMTIEQAINWRAGDMNKAWSPDVLT